mmetsp:Transcript_19019/g.41159  ORF Transcript_19019/g.41159 Transcript_19019/m.41159 type:complete len:81 (-) Transcript_19019:156-398(-)
MRRRRRSVVIGRSDRLAQANHGVFEAVAGGVEPGSFVCWIVLCVDADGREGWLVVGGLSGESHGWLVCSDGTGLPMRMDV